MSTHDGIKHGQPGFLLIKLESIVFNRSILNQSSRQSNRTKLNITMSDKDESTPPAAMSKQLTRMSYGIFAVLAMNIALTLVGIVIAIQVKSQVDQLEEELGPIMELADTLSSSGGVPNN
jgi:hypothetical protein